MCMYMYMYMYIVYVYCILYIVYVYHNNNNKKKNKKIKQQNDVSIECWWYFCYKLGITNFLMSINIIRIKVSCIYIHT